MKRLLILLLLSALVFAQSCKSDKKADEETKTPANDTLPVNSATKSQIAALPGVESENTAGTPAPMPNDALIFGMKDATIVWIGSKSTGSTHTGTLKGKTGSVAYKDGTIVAGNIEIDMKSLSSTDLTGKDKAKLEGHLKSSEFFDIEKYPTAKFEIVKISPLDANTERTASMKSLVKLTNMMTGNLTIKGVTRSVTVPVNINLKATSVKITSSMFGIDRSLWGVNYDIGTISGAVKEAIVDDRISLQLNFEGVKAAK